MSAEPIITVRLLKGSSAKAQILLAFVFSRAINGLDINDLRDWTDLGREAIYHACDTLERQPMGMLTHTVNAHGQYRWYPTGAMLPILRELNHGTPELPEGVSELAAGELQESPRATPELLNDVDVERKKNFPTITTLTTSTERQESPRATPGKSPLERKLDEHIITGKKRREILTFADRDDQPITPEYVQAHIDQAKADPQNWDNPVGVAITRILDGLPVAEQEHPRNCRCPSCIKAKVDRFMNGEGLTRTVNVNRKGKPTSIHNSDEIIYGVAAFMGHEPGCRCIDCQIARSQGTRVICDVCKHYDCTCDNESEGE